MTLQFNITNQHIIRADNEEPVADSKNYLYAHFDFLSNEWDSIEKSAIFSNGEETYTVLLQNDEVLVPWELIHEGIIEVSCFGGDLVTTNTAKIRILASGYTEGETPQPPTPDVYSVITTMLNKLNTTIKFDGSGDKYLADNGIYKEMAGSIEHIKVNGIEQSITDKTVDITIPAIPKDISAFNNDIGYLTEHQSLDAYATNCYVDNEVSTAKAIAKGRATGYVFDTKTDMDLALEDDDFVEGLVLGDNLYIRATDTPDYWWDGSEAQMLETQKVDLSEYLKKTNYATDNTAGTIKTGFGILTESSGKLQARVFDRSLFQSQHGLSFIGFGTLRNIIDDTIPTSPDNTGVPKTKAIKEYIDEQINALRKEILGS